MLYYMKYKTYNFGRIANVHYYYIHISISREYWKFLRACKHCEILNKNVLCYHRVFTVYVFTSKIRLIPAHSFRMWGTNDNFAQEFGLAHNKMVHYVYWLIYVLCSIIMYTLILRRGIKWELHVRISNFRIK